MVARFRSLFVLTVALVVALAWPSHCAAGMPSPRLVLTNVGQRRVEELSFFLLLFFVTAFLVQRLWNVVRIDFPHWPRLTYRRSMALTLLWGLACVVVLTMISGARELMTPAAWEPNGVTHRLKTPKPDERREDLRRKRLEQLGDLLQSFADTHDGRYPATREEAAFPQDAWQHPLFPGLRYGLVAGKSRNQTAELLAFEPEIDAAGRFILLTDGTIQREQAP